jgi:O-antigen/teichoic acid export membrane protein
MTVAVPRSASRPNPLRNVLSNWGAFTFAAVVNLFLAPFVVRHLGNTAYGVWVLLVALVGYLGYLDLGVRGAVTRYVARFRSAADHAAAGRIASAAFTAFTLTGGVAIVVSSVLAALAARAFHVPAELQGVARAVLVLGGWNVAASLISGVFGGIVIGLQRFDYGNAVEIVTQGVRAGAIVAALRAGGGLIALAAIQLAVSVLRGAADVWLSRRLYPELRVRWGVWDRAALKLIFGFGLTSSLLQVLGGVVLYSDSLVIGAFLSAGLITFFAIASSLADYARVLVSGVSQTLTPLVSALEGEGQQERIRGALLTGARVATLVVTPIAVTFLLRGETFIALWMGAAYGASSGAVLRILAVALWAVAGYQVVVAAMMGVGRHGGLVPALLAEAVCNVALSVWWVRTHGIAGVAWGTAVPRLAFSLLFAPWYARRAVGVSMRALWLQGWVRPSLAMLPFAAATVLAERFWPAHHLALYFAQVAVLLPLAGLGGWWICLTGAERRRVTAQRRWWPRSAMQRA